MSPSSFWLLDWIPLAPLVGAIINGLFGKRLPDKVVHWIACLAMGTAFFITLIALKTLAGLPGGHGEEHTYPVLFHRMYQWLTINDLSLNISFFFDPLSAVMCLVITGVGTLIHIYSIGYMHGDRSYARYFTYLNFFCFAMLLLVLGDNLVLLFVGWEGVGLASYLLIGFWYEDINKSIAGKKAFITNRVGDAAVLLGMFSIFAFTQSLDISAIKAVVTGFDAAQLETFMPFGVMIGILFFIGCCGKSAQMPLHVWLPDAMAGPTPVSALIHAATMVTAGVYLIVRMNFLYSIADVASTVVAVVGVLTAFVAASIALTQKDIKGVLAYSTISQLGFMFVAVGVGAYTAGVFHLMTHAFFKALLFLGAGAVIHSLHGEQDINKMGGLKKHLPIVHGTFLIACLAISGIPFFSGFFSKDEILWGAFAGDVAPGVIHILIWALATLTAGMTAFYMFRLYFMTFMGEYRGDKKVIEHLHKPSMSMATVLVVLAVLAAVGGLVGIPEILIHGANGFHDWLHPVVGDHVIRLSESSAHFWEIILMLFSVVVGCSGIYLAIVLYLKRTELPAEIAKKAGRLTALSENLWYFDKNYKRFLFDPLKRVSELLYQFVDRFLIDTVMVSGVSFIGRSAGQVVSALQNGNLQRYAFFIVFGLSMTLLLIYVG